MSGFSVSRTLRRRWTVVVAVVVVALVGFSIYRLHGIFGSDNVISRSGAEALENTGFNPKTVLLEVFGTPGSIATVNYLDADAQPQRVDDVALPWAHELTTDEPTLFADPRRERRRAVESAVAQIRERFGTTGGVTRAELLDAPGRGEDDESVLPRRLRPRDE